VSERRRSLRRDLALGLSAGVAALWLLGLAGAALAIRAELDTVFDSALQEAAERLLPLAVIELINAETAAEARRVVPIAPHAETLTYVVRNPAGVILLASHDADPATFPQPPREGFRDTGTHRIYGRSAVSGAYILEIAEPLAQRRAALAGSLTALALPMLVALPLGILGILWFTRRSLRPVEALSNELAGRGATDLRPLASAPLPEELVPVRAAVDRLMADLARALEAERSFSGNAAHELRTPLAAALAQTQRLIVELPAGPSRDRARMVEAELQRLGRLAANLLDLARAEGALVASAPAQDVVPALAMVAAEFAGKGRLDLRLPDQPVCARIDADAFAILARNLIENALRHGSADRPVTVALEADGVLRVTNGGAVVPPERLARLPRRFERGDGRTSGAGLGLAIAATIAGNSGGHLELASPAPGCRDGFEARFRPAALAPDTAAG
jgi:two-component system, OmpR family, sensor kinase